MRIYLYHSCDGVACKTTFLLALWVVLLTLCAHVYKVYSIQFVCVCVFLRWIGRSKLCIHTLYIP